MKKWLIKYDKVILLAMGLLLGIKLLLTKYEERQWQQQATTYHVPFGESMQTDTFTRSWQHSHYQKLLQFFRNLFEKNNLSKVKPQAKSKVPKIIHQIWLGGSVPEKFKAYQQSWIKHHPDWEYKLWTDENIKNLNLINQKLFDESLNYGEKSDILRYELLYRYGGVYVDFDFECLKPLDLFNHCYDFYTGIQHLDTNKVQLGIGLIGAIPGHPILKHSIDTIKYNATRQIIARTGPIHFTRVFWATAGKSGTTDIAFPASYFYPCGYEQRGSKSENWQKPESFAVHHWAGSWLESSAFIHN